jgi:bifunctional pyridoxal-dependent enzyme with beta-cystathionase and maltose regulon repressor activities
MSLFDFTLEQARQRRGIKWNTYGHDVIPLWIADPDFPVIPEIKAAIATAMVNDEFYYSNAFHLRKAMAKKIKRVNNIDVSAENIYITQGVLPSFWLACRYACAAGDQVVITDPMYYPFKWAISATETTPIYWCLGKKDYSFDVANIRHLITERTKLLFVCNPHNPAGRVLTRRELESIGELAIEKDLVVLVDELWEDIVYDGKRNLSLASLGPEIADRTMTVFGFSKTYGVAGLQIGYLAATNQMIIDRLNKIAQSVLRGTSNLSHAAAMILLSDDVRYYVKALVNHLHEMRALAKKRLAEVENVVCNRLEGTYLMFPDFSSYGLSSTELTDYLLKVAKIAVSDGSLFGSNGNGHIRINIATSRTILTEAFDRLQSALDKLR